MTIDFNRRTLAKAATILSASLGAPMLAGCSGPQHHADNRMMPGTVFTPEALKATAKGKTTCATSSPSTAGPFAG